MILRTFICVEKNPMKILRLSPLPCALIIDLLCHLKKKDMKEITDKKNPWKKPDSAKIKTVALPTNTRENWVFLG